MREEPRDRELQEGVPEIAREPFQGLEPIEGGRLS
jgi:hypothetical protein